jgi:acyl-CoA thioesterase-1
MNRRTFFAHSVALLSALSLLPVSIHADDKAPAKIRVACVGDSITFGSGVKDRDANSYPAVLNRLLGDGYEVRNFGVSGTTLLKSGDKPYWKQKAFADVKAFQPNIVVIKLGTNDTKPQNWKHKDQFAGDLSALADEFAALPSKPTVLLALPVPVHRPNFGINQEALDEQLPMTREVAKGKNLRTIDLFEALKPHAGFFPDGIHPNAEGAAKMAETVAEALKALPVAAGSGR